jgi:hypothetical protein
LVACEAKEVEWPRAAAIVDNPVPVDPNWRRWHWRSETRRAEEVSALKAGAAFVALRATLVGDAITLSPPGALPGAPSLLSPAEPLP